MEYVVSFSLLLLIVLAFIPAMIASGKNASFGVWYVFGLFLFPIALIKAICLKKPVKVIAVHRTDELGNRRKKRYQKANNADLSRKKSFKYLCVVFVTKLIFSVLVSFVALAVIRLYTPPTIILYVGCVVFALLCAIMLSVVEICECAGIVLLADEITKRTLMLFAISAIVSVPMFLLSNLITGVMPVQRQFVRFCATLLSFAGFVSLLFKFQRRYYSIFGKFFDYCILSIIAYVFFAATTLAMLSMSKLSFIAYLIAVPIQIFNFTYFDTVEYIASLSVVYTAAVAHLILAVLLLFSGVNCKRFKNKEFIERVEYRTKAARMSKKRILRRHIPKMNTVRNH